MQAKQHREQAAEMHKTAHDLERVADQLINEAAKLDGRAKASDTEERRSMESLKKFRDKKDIIK